MSTPWMGTGAPKPHESQDCWCPLCRSWMGIYETNPLRGLRKLYPETEITPNVLEASMATPDAFIALGDRLPVDSPARSNLDDEVAPAGDARGHSQGT